MYPCGWKWQLIGSKAYKEVSVMNIMVLRGSPRRNGSSNLLANHFIQGARESGHNIIDVDVAHANIHPCIGCKACDFRGKPCIQNDAMIDIKAQILKADMLVFVTPLYYFGMSAQLKMCLDRCCSINRQITEKRMKSALLVSAWNEDDWTMTALKMHYETLCRYLNFENMGEVLGIGCGIVEKTKESCFPQMAYQLGRTLT